MIREYLRNPMPDAVKSGISDPVGGYKAVQECLTVMLMMTGSIQGALSGCAANHGICSDPKFVNCMCQYPMMGDGLDEALKACWPE